MQREVDGFACSDAATLALHELDDLMFTVSIIIAGLLKWLPLKPTRIFFAWFHYLSS